MTNPQELQPLLAALSSADTDTCVNAVRQLGDLKHAPAVAQLAALRHDERWQVRRAAEQALRQIGTEDAHAALNDTEPQPDEMVSTDKAQRIFRKIAGDSAAKQTPTRGE